MSLCLIVESKDSVWLGGDSAISYMVDGKCLRGRNENAEKAFCHANAVFMCGGSLRNAILIRRYIETLPVITHASLRDIASQLRRIVKDGHRIDPENNVKTVLLLAMLDTGRVCGMSEVNNFSIESPVAPKLNGYRSICCIGVLDEDGSNGRELADRYYAETNDICKMYSKVYSALSSNGVGGHVDLYRLDVKRQKITKYAVPISESGIEYIDATAIMNGGTIAWQNINETGSLAYQTAQNAQSTAINANNSAHDAADLARRIANGTFSGGTFINGREIYAQTIFADEFIVKPSSSTSKAGGYSIYGNYGSRLYNMFRLSYYAGDAPYINFDSPDGAYANWNFKVSHFGNTGSNMSFYGNVNFNGANVTGLYATFA